MVLLPGPGQLSLSLRLLPPFLFHGTHPLWLLGSHLSTSLWALLPMNTSCRLFLSQDWAEPFPMSSSAVCTQNEMVLANSGHRCEPPSQPLEKSTLVQQACTSIYTKFVHRFLEECRGVGDPERHNLAFKYTTLRGDKRQQFLGCGG